MNRLRSFRRIEQINQDILGELLGISKQLVSAIESGRRTATCDITRLGYSPGRFEVAQMTEPLHRQRASTSMASTRRAQELLRLAGEAFCDLLEAIPHAYKNRLERYGSPVSLASVSDAAQDVRVGVLDQEEFRAYQEPDGRCRNRWDLPDSPRRSEGHRRDLIVGQ